MSYSYDELKSQMPDAEHIYTGCTQADCDAMTQDFFRVRDSGTFAIGTVDPEAALAAKEIFPPDGG